MIVVESSEYSWKSDFNIHDKHLSSYVSSLLHKITAIYAEIGLVEFTVLKMWKLMLKIKRKELPK